MAKLKPRVDVLESPLWALVPPMAALRYRVPPTVATTACHAMQVQHDGSAVG
eukprot:CAMPEP_0185015590 /NCGR_PEP_ID=MMETSP1098-20130426/99915_1 /TAXON_ID=89044 /ORGANISM="Spumella elongata, Strain CCAP 955/1" /LENGTH=51 /DNA_ID=CAMNT_0027544721 /DNA_START=249 /DNA_END=404 /DNA_ORIENTATION=-